MAALKTIAALADSDGVDPAMVLVGEIVTGCEDDLNPEPTFGVSGEVHGGWRFFRCEGIAQMHQVDRELRG